MSRHANVAYFAPTRPLLALAVSGVLFASAGQAQVAQEGPAPTAQQLPQQGEPLPNTEPAQSSIPEVSDPMLLPLAPAARSLKDWRQALRLVRSRSTTLATARAQVAQAAAQARQTLGRLHPTLTATGNVNRHLLVGRGTNITAEGPQIDVEIPDPATVWSASVAFRQPLVNLRAWHDAETAERAQRAQGYRADDSERLLLANLADTIVGAVTAERLSEISRVALRSSLSTLDLTQRRARLGAATAVDVLRSAQEVSLNRAQVIAANEAVLRSREALGMALGFAEGWSVTPEVKLDGLARDAAQVCRPASESSARADIRAARANVELAQRRVDSTDYAFAPTLDLTSNLSYSTAPFTSNGKPLQWTVGGLLTVPLYDGGLRYADRAASSAEVQIATETLTQLERQAQLETQQAQRGVQVALQNFEVSRKSRDLSAETARLSRLSFVTGRASSFELVDATRRNQQSELDLVVKEFEVVRAQIIALLAQANCDL
jgi:outer membrane protein TolC